LIRFRRGTENEMNMAQEAADQQGEGRLSLFQDLYSLLFQLPNIQQIVANLDIDGNYSAITDAS